MDSSLKAWRLVLLLSAVGVFVTANAYAVPKKPTKTVPTTIDCYDPNTGWGVAPGAIGVSCRATGVGDTAKAVKYYEHYSLNGNDFLDPISSAAQLQVYTDNVLDLVEQIATDYYRERALLEKRTVSAAELAGWKTAVTAVAFQESYLTHYQFDRRTGDLEHRLNILVGDAKCDVPYAKKPDGRFYCPQFKTNADGMRIFGSQGMFQILMSTHASEAKNGLFDMVQNIQYGMSFYYKNWLKVIQNKNPSMASCRSQIIVNGRVNYQKAAQAAYSVYNGGAAKVCRWAGDSPWRRNDEGYLNAITNKPWLNFSSTVDVRETRKVSVRQPNGTVVKRFVFPFDLQCLRDAGVICLL